MPDDRITEAEQRESKIEWCPLAEEKDFPTTAQSIRATPQQQVIQLSKFVTAAE